MCKIEIHIIFFHVDSYREFFKIEASISVHVSDAPHGLLLANQLNKHYAFEISISCNTVVYRKSLKSIFSFA